jgi:hypothetical protein
VGELSAGSWRHRSAEGRNLLPQLLAKDAARRTTAASAADHPWFARDL